MDIKLKILTLCLDQEVAQVSYTVIWEVETLPLKLKGHDWSLKAWIFCPTRCGKDHINLNYIHRVSREKCESAGTDQ